jgi:long-subunit acyl-CoA synthetase (AMP-forming)
MLKDFENKVDLNGIKDLIEEEQKEIRNKEKDKMMKEEIKKFMLEPNEVSRFSLKSGLGLLTRKIGKLWDGKL